MNTQPQQSSNRDPQTQQSLLDLVQQYEAAGWLNGKQAYEFTSLLQKTPELHEYVSKQIKKVVRTIGSRAQDSTVLEPMGMVGTSTAGSRPTSSLAMELNTSTNQANPELTSKENATSHRNLPLCLEPSEFAAVTSLEDDDGTTIQQLFAEMCFFARLGFVQPPSCLHCTYREGMEQKEPSSTCPRWVVWRKNADVSLHPDMLNDNIMLVQCQAVRKLLKGQSVEGYQWDSKNKQMVVQRE